MPGSNSISTRLDLEKSKYSVVSWVLQKSRLPVSELRQRLNFLALRVIEWVKYGKKFCSYRVHPPLKGGV